MAATMQRETLEQRTADLSEGTSVETVQADGMNLVPAQPVAGTAARPCPRAGTAGAGETGSLVTEYGLIAVVGATVASLVVKWATGGAIWQLFDAVTQKVRVLLGA